MLDVLQSITILFLFALHFINRKHIFKLDSDWAEALKSVREHFKMLDDKVFGKEK